MVESDYSVRERKERERAWQMVNIEIRERNVEKADYLCCNGFIKNLGWENVLDTMNFN